MGKLNKKVSKISTLINFNNKKIDSYINFNIRKFNM